MKPELMLNMKDDCLLEEDAAKIVKFLKQLCMDDLIDVHNMTSDEINERNGD